jgi:hypothetical protein
MSRLHDLVFQMVCNKQHEDDAQILGLVKELASAGVTADQLGAPEDFAIPLPAAVRCIYIIDTHMCICTRACAHVLGGEREEMCQMRVKIIIKND